MTPLKKRIEAMKEMTPTKGFNLVGVDDYEEPGDELFLVGNYATREAAELERSVREKASPDVKFYIYEPEPKNDF